MRAQERGLLAAWLKVPAEAEDEFHDWYNLEHLAQVAGLPGFHSGRRYEPTSGERWFLALYALDDVDVISGPHFQRIIADPSPWSLRMRKHYGPNRIRNVYRYLADKGATAAAPGVAVIRWEPPADAVPGHDEWLCHEAVPALASVEGCRRVRALAAVEGAPARAVVCDLESPGVDVSAAWLRLGRDAIGGAAASQVTYRLLRATDAA